MKLRGSRHCTGGLGGAASVAAALAIAGCAELTHLSDQGGVVGRVLAPPSTSAESTRFRAMPDLSFTKHQRDRFFSLAWRTEDTRNAIRISGVLENHGGPQVVDVTLHVVVRAADEALIRERLVMVPGLLEKKEVRPFVVTIPADVRSSHVAIDVYAFQFPPTGGVR